MMKRLLTYGLLLLTILASHFVVSACQDDAPYEDTEVMVTFTTRAEVKDIETSATVEENKMKDLRVIMLRQDGTVVDNHMAPDINASSITFKFTTPIKYEGEYFTFLAVANEGSIQSTSGLSWITSKPGDNLSSSLSAIQTQQIGNGVLNINTGPIPQSKQWTVHVPQEDTKIPTQRLDFVASKVSVEFKNETNKEQTLKNVRISGFGSATQAYLFKQNGTDFVGQQGVSDKYLLGDEGLTIPVGKSDSLKYYTYPVNTISTPTLHAQWKQGEEYKDCSLDLSGITSLPRNQHLKILITLTGQELVVNYTIAPWNADNTTNIGSPTTNGGYQVDGWGNGNDIIIGGEIGGGEEPEPEPEPDVPVEPGSIVWVYADDITVTGHTASKVNISSEDINRCFVSGNYFGFDVEPTDINKDVEIKVEVFNKWGTNKALSASAHTQGTDRIVLKGNSNFEFLITQDFVTHIHQDETVNEKGYINFWGDNATITNVYIKAPPSQ